MIKATAETLMDSHGAPCERRSTALRNDRLSALWRASRHFTAYFTSLMAMLNRTGAGVLSMFSLDEQRKVRAQRIKDEFFFGCDSKRVPQRAWKRHSAFLAYRQEMLGLQAAERLQLEDQPAQSHVQQSVRAAA